MTLCLGATAGLTWWLVDAQRQETESIRVEVLLDNRCGLVDDAFMAASEPDGATANFQNGVAVIKTFKGSRVYLKANDRYPGFGFESGRQAAAPRVVLVADCGTRVDRALESLREQFRAPSR
jgi:hypothetical protein